MVLLVLDTGLRRSELTGLRRQDLDLGNGVARIRGKGGKQRVVALGQRSLMALRLCLDGRGYPWRSQRTGGPMTADGFYRLCRLAGWIQQRRALEQMRRHSLSDKIAGLGKELP